MTDRRFALLAIPLLFAAPALAESVSYAVNSQAGNNSLAATFDAPLGERITATSSEVGCELSVDRAAGTATGHCSVPLESIKVDGDSTKTKHFDEWATNKKVEPSACRFEFTLASARLEKPLATKTPVPFTGSGRFEICGRAKTPPGPETVTGTVTLMPAGSYGKDEILRLRVEIKGFDRESYGISPKATPGWLARVQQLAPVVAAKGDVNLSLFAKRATP